MEFAEEELNQITYPVVVKPSDSNASRGFSIVSRQEELKDAYLKALAFSENQDIIIEEYMCGREFDVAYYVDQGESYLTFFMENLPVTVNDTNHMIGIIASGSEKDYRSYMETTQSKVLELIRALDFENGHLFFQMFYQNGQFYFTEMNARISGVASYNIFAKTYGINTLHCALEYLRSVPSSADWKSIRITPYEHANIHYILYANRGTVSRIEGLEKVRELKDVIILLNRFNPGDTVLPSANLTQAAFYLSIITADKRQTVQLVKKINEELKLLDADGRNLLVLFEDYQLLQNR